jgi:hypothetical protein
MDGICPCRLLRQTIDFLFILTKGVALKNAGCMVCFVKTTQAVLLFVSVLIAFIIGKEVYPRTVDRPVFVEKVVKVPVEVKVPVIKEVIKEVPAKLSDEEFNGAIAHKLINSARDGNSDKGENSIIPSRDGKRHPEVRPNLVIRLNAYSKKIPYVVNLKNDASSVMDRSSIQTRIEEVLRLAGFEPVIRESNGMQLLQPTNIVTVDVNVRRIPNSVLYSGLVSVHFSQQIVAMSDETEPELGPWKHVVFVPVRYDSPFYAGSSVVGQAIDQRLGDGLISITTEMSKSLK